MKINTNSFNEKLRENMAKTINGEYSDDTVEFILQCAEIKKIRNVENCYDIIVSLDTNIVSMLSVRDMIEQTCEDLGIKINKILIEL